MPVIVRLAAFVVLVLLAVPAVAEDAVTLAVEAEDFVRQRETETRRWYVVSEEHPAPELVDGDPPHFTGAGGAAYLEALPDTRRTHEDELVVGENFSNEPGKMAVLDYEVEFPAAGRYYVWVRAFSTGSEDNGIHVGLDGEWPDSGARLQWCEGKHGWRWESKQRTAAKHCGEPYRIYLDVPEAGRRVVSFSMREDGFEFDRFLVTTDREFLRPEGVGPAAR